MEVSYASTIFGRCSSVTLLRAGLTSDVELVDAGLVADQEIQLLLGQLDDLGHLVQDGLGLRRGGIGAL